MANENEVLIYVAPNGCDNAKGTKEEPLATLEGARNYLRNIDHSDGASVVFAPGEYEFKSSVNFTKEDSNVKYIASGDVVFSGAATIPGDKVELVTDEAVKARLQDPDAVRVFDLSALDIDEKKYFGVEEGAPHFYAGTKLYEVARYPNRDRSIEGQNGPYLHASKTVRNDADGKLKLIVDNKQVKSHLEELAPEAYDDMFIRGYFWVQWNQATYKALSGNPAEREIFVRAGAAYEHGGEDVGKHKRFFIMNVPEELDTAGEYWYDRKNKKLYFIPNDDYRYGMPVKIGLTKVPAVTVDGAENIKFKGIKFNYFANKAAEVLNSENIVFESCEIAHTRGNAATVVNSNNCIFNSCDVYDTALGGLYFHNCGERKNLIPSGNIIYNCIIRSTNKVETCYRPCIEVKNSCGLTIKNCTLSDVAHSLILMEHINDVIIEDNELFNACLDTDDCGAIYWGRDPSDLGIVIRHNYIRNVGNHTADYLVGAMYIDDFATGPEVYNNIFYDCGILTDEKMTCHTNANAIVLNHGQFLNAYNNIFVVSYKDQKPTNLYPCLAHPRFLAVINGIEPDNVQPYYIKDWQKILDDTGLLSDVWRDHYKNTSWAGIWDCANEDTEAALAKYREDHKEDSEQKQYVDLCWAALNVSWDHTTLEGKPYEGTIFEYYKETYGEVLKEHLAEYEKYSPTAGGNPIWDHVFWRAVNYELRFDSTDTFTNNLVVGMTREYLTEDEHLKGAVMKGFYNNYVPADDKLQNGESMFVDYGTNFELTQEGLKEVHKHLPEFNNISMDGIGATR